MPDRPAVLLVVGVALMVAATVALGYAFPPVGSFTRPLVVRSFEMIGPFTPAGPDVELTVQNAGATPITNLTATLYLQYPHEIAFVNVTGASPMAIGEAASATSPLFGGVALVCGSSYPLELQGTYPAGGTFDEHLSQALTCPDIA